MLNFTDIEEFSDLLEFISYIFESYTLIMRVCKYSIFTIVIQDNVKVAKLTFVKWIIFSFDGFASIYIIFISSPKSDCTLNPKTIQA